jgi:hypothetical protein
MGAHTPACLRAASDPVETVTPPLTTPATKTVAGDPGVGQLTEVAIPKPRVRAGPTGSCCIYHCISQSGKRSGTHPPHPAPVVLLTLLFRMLINRPLFGSGGILCPFSVVSSESIVWSEHGIRERMASGCRRDRPMRYAGATFCLLTSACVLFAQESGPEQQIGPFMG